LRICAWLSLTQQEIAEVANFYARDGR